MTASLGALLQAATRQLRAAGVDGADRDARRLMAHAAGVAQARLTLELREPAGPQVAARFAALVARRAAREPLSHLVGERAFFNHVFAIDRHVLDPRPETEVLVRAALDVPFADVLDLGTGSGAILLSLLAERPEATGLGCDLSAQALRVAEANARRIAVPGRARFVLSDWYTGLSGRFDLIVSNPPYIPARDLAALAPELAHEPPGALSDGADGLSAYHRIVPGAGAHLRPGGWLMVETGWKQGAAVRAIFARAGFAQLRILPDLDGRDRVVGGLWPGPPDR